MEEFSDDNFTRELIKIFMRLIAVSTAQVANMDLVDSVVVAPQFASILSNHHVHQHWHTLHPNLTTLQRQQLTGTTTATAASIGQELRLQQMTTKAKTKTRRTTKDERTAATVRHRKR